MRALVRLVAVAGMAAIALATGAEGAADGPALVGQWSAPFWEGGQEPFDPSSLERSARFPTAASSVVLPDGRVLYWNAVEGSEKTSAAYSAEFVQVAENSRARVLDLSGDGPVWTVPTPERGSTDQATPALSDLFCADQRTLYDRTVLIAGGTEWRDGDLYGDRETRIFEPRTDSFSPVEPMDHGRWYPSLVTVADGRVVVVSGVEQLVGTFRPDLAFSQVREVEVFDPARGQWDPTAPSGTSPLSMPLYPRVHFLPNGKVFFSGVGQTFNPFGETPDEPTWALQRFFDPDTQTWTILGSAKYGVRGGAFSVMLRLEPPYDEARILMGGGTLGPTPGGAVATTLSEIVKVRGDSVENEPGLPKGPFDGLAGDQSQMRNRRWFSSGVLLPTGEVIAFSGGDMDGVVDPGSEQAVRMAELYDPDTNTWRELSAGARDRTYHNTAVLLPDGRVLVGGHAPLPAHYHRHDDPAVRSNNFRDATFEVYSPPYLFRGERPRITYAQKGIAWSETSPSSFPISTPEARQIREVVLVRLGATTHIIDNDMRAIRLPFEVVDDHVLKATPPPNGKVAPPGYYYLFVLKDSGEGLTPSKARIVHVGPVPNVSGAAPAPFGE